MNIKQEDLYARAWESDFERPIFDTEYHNAAPPNQLETAVQSDKPTEETWSTPGTSREHSLDVFFQTDELCDVTDKYRHLEPDVETRLEQPNPTPTNTRSSK